MKLKVNMPISRKLKVLLDGVESKDCVEADDLAGVALVSVYNEDGSLADTAFRDLAPGEFDENGYIVHRVEGRVAFVFDSPEDRARAEAIWQQFDFRI